MSKQCYICEGYGVDIVRLGPDLVRHVYCNPGSPRWAEWYERHSERHTEAGDILYKHATKGRVS